VRTNQENLNMAITVNEFLARVDMHAAKARRDRMVRTRTTDGNRAAQDKVMDAREYYFRILPDISMTAAKAIKLTTDLFELDASEVGALKALTKIQTKKVKA